MSRDDYIHPDDWQKRAAFTLLGRRFWLLAHVSEIDKYKIGGNVSSRRLGSTRTIGLKAYLGSASVYLQVVTRKTNYEP